MNASLISFLDHSTATKNDIQTADWRLAPGPPPTAIPAPDSSMTACEASPPTSPIGPQQGNTGSVWRQVTAIMF
ncbi:unnamed protein product [Lota lota]